MDNASFQQQGEYEFVLQTRARIQRFNRYPEKFKEKWPKLKLSNISKFRWYDGSNRKRERERERERVIYWVKYLHHCERKQDLRPVKKKRILHGGDNLAGTRNKRTRYEAEQKKTLQHYYFGAQQHEPNNRKHVSELFKTSQSSWRDFPKMTDCWRQLWRRKQSGTVPNIKKKFSSN